MGPDKWVTQELPPHWSTRIVTVVGAIVVCAAVLFVLYMVFVLVILGFRSS